MRLIDAPVGLFMSKDGEMCLKTEYIAEWGVEAYIVSSGETYWGGAKTAEERNNLDVTPIDSVPVVRCKNCKHCSDVTEYFADHKENKAHSKPGKACFIGLPKIVHPDDFCSYGERRTDNG